MNEKNLPRQKNKTRLIDFLGKLKQEGAIDDEVEKGCLKLLDTSWISALEYLRGLKKLSPEDLGNEWAEHIGVACVVPEKTIIDPVLIQSLPEAFCRDKNCLPLFEFGGTVTTAMVDPFNDETMMDLERRLKKRISPVFAFQSDISRCLLVQSLSRESLTSTIGDLETSLARTLESESAQDRNDEALAELPDAIELIDTLLLWSRKERASDIHIEPMDSAIRVRFRIDGILQVRMRLDKRLRSPIVNRLKVLAGMDITEKRRPQDGNLRITIRGIPLEFRFSTVPSIYGERIVLRSTIETGTKSVVGLDRLGLAPEQEQSLREIIESPDGIFFVTGPTGSGKSTTLFSVIQELNKPEVNIMTVEDPVERRLPGINQTQVNKPINVNFASVLRAFLRQDPDIILIGEIRDLETAKIAAEAALTGHLVLSTMHTNSALQAITRLMDIGVEPFLVAPSIIGVMGQRLLRKLCPACKQPYEPSTTQLEAFFTNFEGVQLSLFKPVGCEDCDNTGYLGRVAIHELFNISDQMRTLISRNGSLVEIEELAREEGFRSMRYDALKRVLQGTTSIEEVMRVVPR